MSILSDEYNYERQMARRRAALENDKRATIAREEKRVNELVEKAMNLFKGVVDSYPLALELTFEVGKVTMEPAIHQAFAEKVIALGYPLEVQAKKELHFILIKDTHALLDFDSSGVYRVRFPAS